MSLACLVLLAFAAPAAADPERSALDARIAELELAVAADEATLAQLISDPATATRLHESPEVAEIAERLPRWQGELKELRERRGPAPAPEPDAD